MTTKTFFDMGVYKSTLKRFYLGSVLYLILSFLTTGMVMLLAYDPAALQVNRYYSYHHVVRNLVIPTELLALCVPTVVALLVYRFVHSKKMSIFVHSLPVTRRANYISTLAGAFTLMAVPVIINGIILMMISMCGYSGYFSKMDCIAVTMLALLILFVMFSISTFSAMCTGNSFAVVGLNAALIFAPLVIASITETLLLNFLYGYPYNRSLLSFFNSINPITYLCQLGEDIVDQTSFSIPVMAAYIAFATVLYVISYVLYKKRRCETSEDVAGFKVLDPIFKYFVTFVVTIGAFAVFLEFISEKTVFFVFAVVLCSMVSYFGSEMVLKKKVKVWGAYKGYLVFGGVFVLFIMFIAFTSVFGYETYVPKEENIKSAAIYNYYYGNGEPFTKNEEISKYITEVHTYIVKGEKPVMRNDYVYDGTRIHFNYTLKNGKEIERVYWIATDKRDEIMGHLYEYPEYRFACEEVFADDVESIESISFERYDIDEKPSKLTELFECIKEDAKSLSYSQMHGSGAINVRYCNVRYKLKKENDKLMSFDGIEKDEEFGYMDIQINRNYEKTLEWLTNNNYEHIVKEIVGDDSPMVEYDEDREIVTEVFR